MVWWREDARTLSNSRKREERVLLSMMACKGWQVEIIIFGVERELEIRGEG